jgi:hypothetical protein
MKGVHLELGDDTPRGRLEELSRDPRAGLRRAVAQHPATPPELLARLALDDNFWVRTDAAAHPAFPEELRRLLRLAGSSADLAAFAEPDPSLQPQALEELAAAGPWGQRLAARHPATPSSVLGRLGDHPSALLRADLARHPEAPAALPARLLEDGDLGVRRAAASHPRLPRAALDLLRRAGAGEGLDGTGAADPDLSPSDGARLARGGPFARLLAARHPGLPATELTRLAADPDPEIRRAAAQNPASLASALLQLAHDEDPRVQQALAGNAAAPAEALLLLAQGDAGNVDLLASLAAHPSAPPQLLARLAEQGASRVRERVAAHPTYPEAHRRLLVRAGSTPDLQGLGDPDPALAAEELARLARGGAWARRLAAGHPATPAADLARLAADGDLLVRHRAATNPATPQQILDLLARAGGRDDLTPSLAGKPERLEGTLAPATGRRLADGRTDGRQDGAASEPPAGEGGLRADEFAALVALGPWGRRLAAIYPAAGPELLSELAADADPATRAAVADHPRAPEDVLVGLAQDPSAAVRWAVARRPDAPAEALHLLGSDPAAAIRASIARHPDADATDAPGCPWRASLPSRSGRRWSWRGA